MTAIVCFLPRAIPMGENVFFLASLLCFVVSFIVCLAVSKTKQPGKVVFTEFVNVTGWSDGTAFMLGVGSCMYAFLATDGATHIAEVSILLRSVSTDLTSSRNYPTRAKMCPARSR